MFGVEMDLGQGRFLIRQKRWLTREAAEQELRGAGFVEDPVTKDWSKDNPQGGPAFKAWIVNLPPEAPSGDGTTDDDPLSM